MPIINFSTVFLIFVIMALIFLIQHPQLILIVLIAYACVRQLQLALQQFNQQKPNTNRNIKWSSPLITQLFAILGHIAKTDGKVDQASIVAVEKVMKKAKLNKSQRLLAIKSFNSGKQNDFSLDYTLQQLRLQNVFFPKQQQTLLQIMIEVGYAEGKPSKKKRMILHHIAAGFGQRIFNHQQWQQYQHHYQRRQQQHHQHNNIEDLNWAYDTLGATSREDLATVTKKYRKLLSKFHPDRINAQGKKSSSSSIKEANEKTRKIRKAYDIIKQQLSHTHST